MAIVRGHRGPFGCSGNGACWLQVIARCLPRLSTIEAAMEICRRLPHSRALLVSGQVARQDLDRETGIKVSHLWHALERAVGWAQQRCIRSEYTEKARAAYVFFAQLLSISRCEILLSIFGWCMRRSPNVDVSCRIGVQVQSTGIPNVPFDCALPSSVRSKRAADA